MPSGESSGVRTARPAEPMLREVGEEHRLALVVELLGGEAALLEGLLEPVGVLLDVGRVGRVVRQREELEIFVEARLREPGFGRGRRLREGEGRNGEEEQKKARHGYPPWERGIAY